MTIEEQGSAHAVNSEAKAHWVSADCGDIKSYEPETTLSKQQRAEQRAAAAKMLETKLKEESQP